MSFRTKFLLPLAFTATVLPTLMLAQSSPDPNAPAQNASQLKQEEANNKAQARQSSHQAKQSKKAAKADKKAAKNESKVEGSQKKAAEENEKANTPPPQ